MTPLEKDFGPQFDQLLRGCVERTIGMKELLNEERSALEAQDADALLAIAAGKQHVLSQLDALEKNRREICHAGGFSSHPDEMESIVKSCDNDSTLLGSWNRFVELARECSDLNARNGAIINVRYRQIAGALAVVRGERQGNQTYGRDGRDSAGNAKRVLAQI